MSEQDYDSGWHRALLSVLRHTLRELGYGPGTSFARIIAERTETMLALRDLCAIHGDNDWPSKLNLADVVNKHLAIHLQDAGWVSVTDRLPDHERVVMVWFVPSNPEWGEPDWSISWCRDGEWLQPDEFHDRVGTITHWMEVKAPCK